MSDKNLIKKRIFNTFQPQKNHQSNTNNPNANTPKNQDENDDDQDFRAFNKKNNYQHQPEVKKLITDLANKDYKANQQRNLARETGGVEQKETFFTSEHDVWDSRIQEIEEMAEIEPQDYNSDNKASMIWEKKRKKKQQEILNNQQENSAIDSRNNSFSFFSSKPQKGRER